MEVRDVLFALVATVLTVVTGFALATDGFWAIFGVATSSWAGAQVFTDLALALLVASRWLARDARSRGMNPWPWLIAFLPLGSLSIVIYMLWTRVLARGSSTPPTAQ